MRKLRFRSGVVKVFWFALVALSLQANAQETYAKLIVEQGLFWLPHYLEEEHDRQFGFDKDEIPDDQKRKAEILDEFQRIATVINLKSYKVWYEVQNQKHRFAWKDIVQFREGGDKIFNLQEGEPARTAVTGTDEDSQIIFNLGLISNPEQFNFGEALALWTHEIGHKVRMKFPELTQKDIDELADRIGTVYGRAARIYEADKRKIFVLSPTSLLSNGKSCYPFMMHGVIPMSFGVIENGVFRDLSEQFNHALNSAVPPYKAYLEHERWIYNLQPLPDGKILIELGTVRLPTDLTKYSSEQIGGTFSKLGVLDLGHEFTSVTVERYIDQVTPRPFITDADAEVEALTLSDDQNQVTGLIRFHMKNETHFHAMSYPSLRFQLLGLLDGRPVRFEAQALLRMTKDVSAMPAEIYKRPTLVEGRLSFSTRDLQGNHLEITGVESRFFRLGGYDFREEKRIRLREVREVNLGCAANLVRR